METVEKEVKIAAVMSCPRLGFADHWGLANYAFNRFDPPIPIHYATGCFWGHSLQSLLEDRIAEGCEWAITMDFDSVFTSNHVRLLLKRMVERPDIDALAPVQMRRGVSEQVLLAPDEGGYRLDDDGNHTVSMDDGPIKCRWVHFGLTIIRLDRLKDIPKPWFQDVPDANGSWRDGRQDDDIYFWNNWKKHGRTAYIEPEVRIGHLQMMVSDYDAEFKPRHIHVHQWRNENMLVEV